MRRKSSMIRGIRFTVGHCIVILLPGCLYCFQELRLTFSVQLGRIMRMRLLMMHLWQELVRTCSWIWMPNSTVLRRRCFARSLYWLYFRHQCWHRCYRESQTYPEAGRESRDPLSCERYVPERWLADLPRPSTVTPATSSLGYSSRSTVSGNSHASYGCRQAHRRRGQIYNRELFC